MVFVEQLYWERVRQLCIERNLYTRGNNEEYAAMFAMCKGEAKKVIPEVAKDILAHSDTEMTELDLVSALYNRCCLRWVEEG